MSKNVPLFFRIILLLLFLITGRAGSQELPPVVNFDPIEYGAGNQNWMISQGEDHNIYVANDNVNSATGKVYLSEGEKAETIKVSKKGNSFEVSENPLKGQTFFKTEWKK